MNKKVFTFAALSLTKFTTGALCDCWGEEIGSNRARAIFGETKSADTIPVGLTMKFMKGDTIFEMGIENNNNVV